jgi:hypothetical protein
MVGLRGGQALCLCPTSANHHYMVTFPAACCREGYRDMVVFIHTRVKDVGSDRTVRVDVLWNEPKSGAFHVRAEAEIIRVNLRE